MLCPTLSSILSLLSYDVILLCLLKLGQPFLAPLGAPAIWLEAALHLLALWGARHLLYFYGPSRIPPATLVTLGLLRLLYPSLGCWFGGPPLLSSTVLWSWLLVGYGVVTVVHLVWGSLRKQSSTDGTKKEDQATLWMLVKVACPDAPYLFAAFLFLLVAVSVETFIPYYAGQMFDISSKRDTDAFSFSVLHLGMVWLVSCLSSGCQKGLFAFTMFRMNVRIRGLLFSSLVRQDLSFFQEVKTGDLTSRLSEDTTLISHVVQENVNTFLLNLLKAVGFYGFMFSLSWRLTLLTLVLMPIMIAIQRVYDGHHQALLLAVRNSMARSREVVLETVSSIETVRSFATEEEESRCYGRALDETYRLKNRRDWHSLLYALFRRILLLGLLLIVLSYGFWQVSVGLLTKGNLLSFILYQGEMGGCLKGLISSFGNLWSNVGAAEKVFKYLYQEPLVRTEGTLTPDVLHGAVSFRNVSFCYPSRPNTPVLKNVSFDLHPGQITALVGLNGCGKSTCVALLQRFYEPQSGEILLDEVPIREYEHKYLHSQVAVVGQEPLLFSGSIRDNIAYGIQECCEDAVVAAAKESDALGFIHDLEGGIMADVGEKGGKLSTGQKQRLALARALIRNPKVLILDEATSALDAESESAIQRAVLSLQTRTVLVITHRLQTVENADKIVMLENGEVVEEGIHAELIDQRGPYSRLVQRNRTE